MPDLLHLRNQFLRVAGLHHNGDVALRQPTDLIFVDQHNRGIILVECLLMVVLHHSDNLHRSIGTFHLYLFAESLFVRGDSQVTDSRLVDHQLIHVVSIIFGESAPCHQLQSISINIIRVAYQHFIKAILLQSITLSPVRQEGSHLFARHGTREGNFIYQRQAGNGLLHGFEFRVHAFGPSGKFDNQSLVRLHSQRLIAHEVQLRKHNQCAAEQNHRCRVLNDYQYFASAFARLAVQELSLQQRNRFPVEKRQCRIVTGEENSPYKYDQKQKPPVSRQPNGESYRTAYQLIEVWQDQLDQSHCQYQCNQVHDQGLKQELRYKLLAESSYYPAHSYLLGTFHRAGHSQVDIIDPGNSQNGNCSKDQGDHGRTVSLDFGLVTNLRFKMNIGKRCQ